MRTARTCPTSSWCRRVRSGSPAAEYDTSYGDHVKLTLNALDVQLDVVEFNTADCAGTTLPTPRRSTSARTSPATSPRATTARRPP